MKRRNLMIGLGALSAGSGATMVSGAFDGSANVEGGDGLQVVSTAEVNLIPNNGDYDENLDEFDDISELEGADGGRAAVSGGEDDGELEIDVVTRINASSVTFDNLFEIENVGTEKIAVSVELGADDDVVDEIIEENDDLTESNGEESIRDDIKEAYSFEIDDTDLQETTVEIDSVVDGENSKNVDLTVDLDGDIVSNLVSTGIGAPGEGDGNPFTDGAIGDGETLVDEVRISAASTHEDEE